MSELTQLEQRRAGVLEELDSLGDFRKCGKKNCVCAAPEHQGHGPQYLWNATVSGRSHARNLKLGPELEKVQTEVINYGTFLRLMQELVDLNEAICVLRPVDPIEDPAELETLKKKLRKQFDRKSSRRSSASAPR